MGSPLGNCNLLCPFWEFQRIVLSLKPAEVASEHASRDGVCVMNGLSSTNGSEITRWSCLTFLLTRLEFDSVSQRWKAPVPWASQSPLYTVQIINWWCLCHCFLIIFSISSFRNPNYPHNFSRRLTGAVSPWPMFLSHANGDNYKEFTVSLPNHKGLKRAECSFWSDYIKTLKVSTSK